MCARLTRFAPPAAALCMQLIASTESSAPSPRVEAPKGVTSPLARLGLARKNSGPLARQNSGGGGGLVSPSTAGGDGAAGAASPPAASTGATTWLGRSSSGRQLARQNSGGVSSPPATSGEAVWATGRSSYGYVTSPAALTPAQSAALTSPTSSSALPPLSPPSVPR